MAYAEGYRRGGNTGEADSRIYCNRQELSRKWNNPRGLFGEDYMDYLLPRTAKGESQSGFCLVVDGVAEGVQQFAAAGGSNPSSQW
jgi:hypothetical protein